MDANENRKVEEDILLEFLLRTKDGEYAPIDMGSLKYVRMEFVTEPDVEDHYPGLS